MRIRKKKWAEPELSVCDFFVKNPEEYAGKWQSAFKKEQPLVLEIGCGKGSFAGRLALENPDKNIIARAIRAKDTVDPDFFHRIVEPGQFVLLCSDGLTNMVEDERIQAIIMGDGAISEKVDLLVDEANHNGGKDNISAIIVDPFVE